MAVVVVEERIVSSVEGPQLNDVKSANWSTTAARSTTGVIDKGTTASHSSELLIGSNLQNFERDGTSVAEFVMENCEK